MHLDLYGSNATIEYRDQYITEPGSDGSNIIGPVASVDEAEELFGKDSFVARRCYDVFRNHAIGQVYIVTGNKDVLK